MIQVFRVIPSVGSRVECGAFCVPTIGCTAFAVDEDNNNNCYIMDRETRHGVTVAGPTTEDMKCWVATGR